MKKFLCLLAAISLGACAVMSVESKGGLKVITYKADAPEFATDHSTMTPYARQEMLAKADEVCPSGYDFVKQYRVIDPPSNSRQVWEIRCRK